MLPIAIGIARNKKAKLSKSVTIRPNKSNPWQTIKFVTRAKRKICAFAVIQKRSVKKFCQLVEPVRLGGFVSTKKEQSENQCISGKKEQSIKQKRSPNQSPNKYRGPKQTKLMFHLTNQFYE